MGVRTLPCLKLLLSRKIRALLLRPETIPRNCKSSSQICRGILEHAVDRVRQSAE
jgi:hypothetical protein